MRQTQTLNKYIYILNFKTQVIMITMFKLGLNVGGLKFGYPFLQKNKQTNKREINKGTYTNCVIYINDMYFFLRLEISSDHDCAIISSKVRGYLI